MQQHTEKIKPENIVFNNQVSVSPEIIDTDFLLSYPMCLLLTHDNLIVWDERGHDGYFHVIDKESGLLVAEFGKKGMGPNQLLRPTTNPVYNYLKDDIRFFDIDSRKLFRKNNEDGNLTGKNLTKAIEKYNIYIRDFLDMDEYYLAVGMNGLFDENRFAVFDTTLKILLTTEKYPVLDYDSDKNKKLVEDCFNIFFLKPSPDNKKVVFASYKTGLLEFFDLNRLPDSIVKVKSLLLTDIAKNDNERIWGFEDIYPTNRFVYVLHNGKPLEENKTPYYSESIKVFDWHGNPIVEYNTGLDMRCLAVDEDAKCIYIIAYEEKRGFFLARINIH